MKENTLIKTKLRGSLLGGAVGDALGYPVEFTNSYKGIQSHYGPEGITRYDIRLQWIPGHEGEAKALISDDTQMTLFTSCGLLNAYESQNDPLSRIREAYLEWYFTQTEKKNNRLKSCWISEHPELYARRAPGNTCMNALADILSGREVHNHSKGCGGVMRIAPIALFGAVESHKMDIRTVDALAADASKLTHHHPLGYIPSALLAHVIYRLVQDEKPTRETCRRYIREGLDYLTELFPDHPKEVAYLTLLAETAMDCADTTTTGADMPQEDAVIIETRLGYGWTAEETVAIAFYCTLKYFDDFEKAMIAAVNHAGDSDSTGAVTGNLLGAAVGYESIPTYYIRDLELHDLMVHVADDLYLGRNTPDLKQDKE